MAGVKLQLQPRHARLFDTHAKGEPRQRIAHLYQTIRMRPAIFGKYVKDMDNVKPACAVIFRGDIGETVESLLGKLSPTELQTLGCTIDAIDYARRAEIAIYKRDPPSFSLLAEHQEGGLIVGKHVTQEEKDQIVWRLWYILAMLMVDDDTLADEEQTPWDEDCLSVTLYCWVKHLMGITDCMSEATCRCASVARTYEVPASAFRAAWVYVDKRCHRWLPSDRYRTIPVSSLAPEVRITDIFLDTVPPKKLPTMASVIHLPIPPYHSIRLKPPSSRACSLIKPFISAQHSKKLNAVISGDPLEELIEIPIHPPFLTNYMEMTTGKMSKSGGICYEHISKLVSRSLLLKQGCHSKWKSVTLRDNEWVIVGWALFYRRDLGLCIKDICGAVPSPAESFKPWHIGRLVDMLMYLQVRKQGGSRTHKNTHGHNTHNHNTHGYYPNFRGLVLSARHCISKGSTGQTTEGESLRRWVLLRSLWELLGRLFVWEDANVKPFGGSGSLSTTQINDSINSTLVIDWNSTAFPLAITSWVKHSLPYSTCYVSVNDANCKCKSACKLYNVSYDEFLVAFRIVDSICKREGWTIESLTYTKTNLSGTPERMGTSNAGKTSSTPALASQTPITIIGTAENHPPPSSRGSKFNGVTLAGSPERKTSTNKALAMEPAPPLSAGPSLLRTSNNATRHPTTSSSKCRRSLQDKPVPKRLNYRRRVSLKTLNCVESIENQEYWYENSLDSDSDSDSDPDSGSDSDSGSGSDSDQDFKPEQVFDDSSETDTGRSRPRKIQLDVHADVKIKRSTRVTAPHKLVDWSSESDDGATPDVLWKRNRRGIVSPPTPCPNDGGVKRPGRPHTHGSSRMNCRGENMRRPPAPGPRFDSQKGQIPYSMDFLEPDNLNIKVSRNPEVGASAGHQLFVSDIRPLLMSPAECERLEGRTTYAVPKSVNYQVGNYDREPGSNLNPRDTNRETGHRVTPDMRHTVIPRTWSLGSKKRKYHQGDRLAPGSDAIGLSEENQPEPKRFKRVHPVLASSEDQLVQQSTSCLSEISLVIYDLNPDRRKPSPAEEKRRLLNECRLSGIPIALNVRTIPESGGIGICEPLSAEVLKKLDHKRISYLRDHLGLIFSFKFPAPLLPSPIISSPRTSYRVLDPTQSVASPSGSEVDVHSEPDEQETLSIYDDQSKLRKSLTEEAHRLVGLIEEACRTDMRKIDWNIEMVRGHVAVVLRDKDAIRRTCSILAPTSVRKEVSRRNLTVLRGGELWVVPPVISRTSASQTLHHAFNVNVSAQYQHNLALFNKTVAARTWTAAAVQGFHW